MRSLPGFCALLLFSTATAAAAPAVDWQLGRSPTLAGDTAITTLGSPKNVPTASPTYSQFNGTSDGYVVERNPLAGWTQFSIEMLVRADLDGEAEPRFLHITDSTGAVLTLEFRIGADASWALDAYVKQSPAHLKLFDATRRHSAGAWHWVALTYDGKTLTSFVDGQKDLSGEVALKPFATGRTSLGFRQNKVFWFKGAIAEFRASPKALSPAELSR